MSENRYLKTAYLKAAAHARLVVDGGNVTEKSVRRDGKIGLKIGDRCTSPRDSGFETDRPIGFADVASSREQCMDQLRPREIQQARTVHLDWRMTKRYRHDFVEPDELL